MSETVNWDDLIQEAGDSVSTSYDALPAGDYDLEVVDVEATKTKKDPPRPMYKVKSKVIGGAYANRLLWDNVVLTTDNPQALGFFFRKMAAMGLGLDYFKSKPSDAHIVASLKGRKFRAKIGQRTYQGELQNEFKTYYQPQSGQAEASSGNPAPAAPAPAPAQAPPPPAPAPAPAAQAQPAPAPAPQQAAPAPAPQQAPPAAAPTPAAAPPPPPPALGEDEAPF